MASGKTSNYKLNQWAAEDRIIREEFNADNAAIDAALASIQATAAKVNGKADSSTLEAEIAALEAKIPKIVTGTYTGDGAESQTVGVGFTPKAVFTCTYNGKTHLASSIAIMYGGLALTDAPAKHKTQATYETPYYTAIEIVSSGFKVYQTEISEHARIYCNESGTLYHYIAIG